jgi:hypothetical protein
MDPRQKDGVRAHPFVFAAGVCLHAGIGAAAASLLAGLVDAFPPAWLRVLLLALSIIGAGGGLLLLARRVREPVLQAISIADDYISNLLVLAFLVAAAVFLLFPPLKSALFLTGALLLAYAPFGKIRHCVLFFVTRARFGAFIATRGLVGGRSPR